MLGLHPKKSRLALTVLVLLLLSILPAGSATTPDTSYYWAASYGGTEDEQAWSLERTSDGGTVVAGWTESFGGPWSDGWILKLRADGSIQWQNSYGNIWDLTSLIIQTSDGGYAVAGFVSYPPTYVTDFWILKLRENGTIEWQKAYGGPADDEAVSVQETLGGGYVVAGDTKSFGMGDWDIWVVKISETGSIQWEKTYGGDKLDRTSAEPIAQTADGGYILAGRTESFAAGGSDLWVLKLKADGTVDWQKTYGGQADDMARSIKQTPDSGYVVAGYTKSFGAGDWDIWVLKLGEDGTPQWQRAYGGTEEDKTYSIQLTSDGGYVLAGETESFGAGGWEAWVLKLKEDGTIHWEKTFGGDKEDGATSIRQTSDAGYLVAGLTETFGAGKLDFWVLKLDFQGNILACPLGTDSSAIIEETDVACVESDAKPSAVHTVTITDTGVAPAASAASVSMQCFVEANCLYLPVVTRRAE